MTAPKAPIAILDIGTNTVLLLIVEAGTQNGRVYRLRGRGVPHVDGRGRGDLLVQVIVDVPTRLTKEQDELVRRLAAERDEEVAPADEGFFARIKSAFR